MPNEVRAPFFCLTPEDSCFCSACRKSSGQCIKPPETVSKQGGPCNGSSVSGHTSNHGAVLQTRLLRPCVYSRARECGCAPSNHGPERNHLSASDRTEDGKIDFEEFFQMMRGAENSSQAVDGPKKGATGSVGGPTGRITRPLRERPGGFNTFWIDSSAPRLGT